MNAMGTAVGEGRLDEAVSQLLVGLSEECTTCTGLICLDCVQAVAHDTCTRACPDCAAQDVDWEQSWETTQIVTELAGLHRLDEAVRAHLG